MLNTVEKITLSLPVGVVKVLKKQSRRGTYSSYVAEAILEKHRAEKRAKIKALKGSIAIKIDYKALKDKEIHSLQEVVL